MVAGWVEFLTLENFQHAWRIIEKSPRYEVRDTVFAEVYQAQTDIHLQILIDGIEAKGYEPQRPEFFYHIKPNGWLRPFAYLTMSDRIVYQAIGNILLQNAFPNLASYSNISLFGNVPQPPDEDGNFGDYVFFNSTTKGRRIGQYDRFTNAVKQNRWELSLSRGDWWEVKTDINSFYPSVNHSILLNELKNQNWLVAPELIELLRLCLDIWSYSSGMTNSGMGIPLGYETSELLATLYLFHLHEWLGDHLFLNYVDDIRLYVEGEQEARLLLSQIELNLQTKGLFINTKKTDLTPCSIELEDTELTSFEEQSNDFEDTTEPNVLLQRINQLALQFENNLINLIREKERELAFIIYRMETQDSLVKNIALLMLDYAPRHSYNISSHLSMYSHDNMVANSLYRIVLSRNPAKVKTECMKALLQVEGYSVRTTKVLRQWFEEWTDWKLQLFATQNLSGITVDHVKRLFAKTENVQNRAQIIYSAFSLTLEQNAKVELVKLALKSNHSELQKLGLYLWRRDGQIDRSRLRIPASLVKLKNLYQDTEEQQDTIHFSSHIFKLFGFNIDSNLPLTDIFQSAKSPSRLLINLVDSQSKSDRYIRIAYDLVVQMCVYVIQQSNPDVKGNTLKDIHAYLSESLREVVRPIRLLRNQIEKNDRLSNADFEVAKTQIKRCVALLFSQLHEMNQLSIDQSLAQACRLVLERKNTVFISYSHKDEEWLTRLKDVLKPHRKILGLDIWDDKRIKAGDTWRSEIEVALQTATVAVLLVTVDFASSEFINTVELPKILDREREEGLRVIWIAISDAAYKEIGLSHIQAANPTETPLEFLEKPQQTKALVEIARNIELALKN
jgi:hypothetical protein